MADLNTLKTDAGTIRDASQQNENTAFRIGSWLVDLIEFLTNTSIEAVMTSIIPSVTADGIVLTINYQKADGTTFSNSITLPLADAEKAGLMSPTMVAKISALQSSINACNTKNTTQDSQIQALTDIIENNGADIDDVTITANNNKDKITSLQNFVTDNASAIDALQKSLNNIASENAEQDSSIVSALDMAERANISVETAAADTQIIKDQITSLQNFVTDNASAIDALQKSSVQNHADFEEKDAEHDNAIEIINAQLDSLVSLLTSYEQHLLDFNNDVVGASKNDGKGALFPRVIKLEENFSELQPEIYVLNFTVKEGEDSGSFPESEYDALREAVEARKIIIIAGTVTTNVACSTSRDADHVVIRYETTRFNEGNTITTSIYELKFGHTDYSTKVIHKLLN